MLEPLTKRRTDGTLYKRRPDTEKRLNELLALSRVEQLAALKVRDRRDPHFVPSECLIYLLRRADRDNSPTWFHALFTILRNRCKLNLEQTVRSGGMADDASLREEVLSRFELYIATGLRGDPERLDPLEVAFDLALASIRKDAFGGESRRSRRFTEMPTSQGGDDDDTYPIEFAQPVSELAADLGLQESEFAVFRGDAFRSIIVLPEDERDAILLLLQGFPIDSKKESVDTIAKRHGVDERTIRNRIKRGIERLNKRGTSK